jgi:hypothetical protein
LEGIRAIEGRRLVRAAAAVRPDAPSALPPLRSTILPTFVKRGVRRVRELARPTSMVAEGVEGPDDPRVTTIFYAEPLAAIEQRVYGRAGQAGLLLGRFGEEGERSFVVVQDFEPLPAPGRVTDPLAFWASRPEGVACFAAELNRRRLEKRQQVVGCYASGPSPGVPEALDRVRRAALRDPRFATAVLFARQDRAPVATGWALEYTPCPHEVHYRAAGGLRRTPVLHVVPGKRLPSMEELREARRFSQRFLTCVRCGQAAPKRARRCPHCGWEVVDRRRWLVRHAPTIVGGLMGALQYAPHECRICGGRDILSQEPCSLQWYCRAPRQCDAARLVSLPFFSVAGLWRRIFRGDLAHE